MPTCYFFKDGQIVKEYPNWDAYCRDDSYTPEKNTYHWEIGDKEVIAYSVSSKEIEWIDIDNCPPEIQTLLLLLG